MQILSLAWKSLRNRIFTVALTVTVIALSVTLLLGVERIRQEARNSFTNTVSGTDLIVGARSSRTTLLLASIFHIGNMENNISWASFEEFSEHPQVSWAIPLSLGDSHKGYRVLGTSGEYFQHFQYGQGRFLQFADGRNFTNDKEVVLGAEAAQKLNYKLGDKIVVSHGTGDMSFHDHADKPFVVVGILAATGTPVDRTLHVDLGGIEAIHEKEKQAETGHDPLAALLSIDDHHGEAAHHTDDENHHGETVRHAIGKNHLGNEPEQITAFLLGLKSRGAALGLQRAISTYGGEPLTAAMPGVTLQEIWQAIGVAENALLAVAILVVVVGLFCLLAVLMTSLNERRREMAILRSVGARPRHLFTLMVGEATWVTLLGTASGVALLQILILFGQPLIASHFGLYLQAGGINGTQLILIVMVCLCGALIGLVPGYRVYRNSLADGMTVRF